METKEKGLQITAATPNKSNERIYCKDTKYSLLSEAKSLINKGFSVVVTGSDKKAVGSWKEYQKSIIPDRELELLINKDVSKGIALVGGCVSGGLEIIDVDLKYDISGNLEKELIRLIKEQDLDLYNSLRVIRTPSGGLHFYFRSETPEGNQKLARRPATEQELKNNPNTKVYVLIETRGEGGYAITFPSPGYTIIQDNEIPIITIDQRELLLNTCRSFNQLSEVAASPKRDFNSESVYSATPWDDFNKNGSIEDLLTEHGWTVFKENSERVYYTRPGKTTGISADYHKEKKLFKVWTTSSSFDSEKAYSHTAILAGLKYNNDFSAVCKELEVKGYGKRVHNFQKVKSIINRYKANGKTKEEIITELKYSERLTDQEAEEIIQAYDNEAGPFISEFWEVGYEKKAGNYFKRISFNRTKFCRYLSNSGTYKYYYEEGTTKYMFIKKTGCLIEEISTEQIKESVKQYVASLPDLFDLGTTRDELLEIIYKGADTYFSKAILEFLDPYQPDFLTDTESTAYKLFRNGVVCIDRDNRVLKQYGEIGKDVWKSSVIPFDIALSDDNVLTGEYYEFTCCICGNDKAEQMTGEQADKWFYLKSIIGYLLHKYKDPSRPYAIVLGEETENEEKGGGTGKGIVIKGLGHLSSVVDIDGKTFNSESQFAWQRVNLDTNIIAVQDTKKHFYFESLFNVITEGLQVQKKHRDEFFIPFKRSPKIVITTNFTVDQNSNAAKRRQKVFEFSGFFSPGYTPEQHFKHKLFDGWDNEEWNRFYNFNFYCISFYLDKGIQDNIRSESLNKKHIKLKYSEDFLEWFQEYSGNGCAEFKAFNELYNEFLIVANEDKNRYSGKKFKSGIKESASLFGFKLEEQRNYQANRRKEIRLLTNTI
ncbi:MAG: bifunctional DNA primase/polymerase [Flavisolibacter sp.]